MSVQVTDKDIVLFGHGSYEGGAIHMQLPHNIDLYVLQPIGYSLKAGVAKALIDQELIQILALRFGNSSPTDILVPFVKYSGGSLAPNFILYNLGELSEWGKKTIGDKENVVTVNEDTLLSELISNNEKIQSAIKSLPEGEKLKLYWSACANQISGYTAGLS